MPETSDWQVVIKWLKSIIEARELKRNCKSILPSTFVEGYHDVDAVSRMEYRKLGNTDMDVSAIGFGAACLGGVYCPISDRDGVDLVKYAIKQGINYIDTAPWYGNGKSETVLGKILPSLPRESYFIATKVGRYEPKVDKMFDFSAKKILASIDESLERLQLDYVDLLQVHDIEFAPSVDQIINETLPALQKIKESGKARYIGITGYPLNILRRVAKCSSVGHIDTILSYCRYTLFDTSLSEHMDYFESRGYGVINAAPIGMGLLSPYGPPIWHPATAEMRNACKLATQHCHNARLDIARLALRLCIDYKKIATTLVSSTNFEILRKNITTAYKPLTPEETNAVKIIKKRYFQDLQCHHWEGIELIKYHNKLNRTKISLED